MKLTFDDYMEFIESLTPEQAYQSGVAFFRAIPPRLHLLLAKQQQDHMAHNTDTNIRIDETYPDGSKLHRVSREHSVFTSTFDTITDKDGNEVK